MPTTCLPLGNYIIDQIPTSKSMPMGVMDYFNQRLPTDPFYFATLTIQNVVDGSQIFLPYPSCMVLICKVL